MKMISLGLVHTHENVSFLKPLTSCYRGKEGSEVITERLLSLYLTPWMEDSCTRNELSVLIILE